METPEQAQRDNAEEQAEREALAAQREEDKPEVEPGDSQQKADQGVADAENAAREEAQNTEDPDAASQTDDSEEDNDAT